MKKINANLLIAKQKPTNAAHCKNGITTKMAKVYPTGFNERLRRNSSHLARLRLEDDYRERSPWTWTYSKPVSIEEVRDEGEQLLVHFVKEEISKEHLETPEELDDEFDLR